MNIRVLVCLRTMSTNAGDVQVDAAWKGMMIKVGQVNSNDNSENTTEDEREEWSNDALGRGDGNQDLWKSVVAEWKTEIKISWTMVRKVRHDHEEILLDGTAQSVRNGETLREIRATG